MNNRILYGSGLVLGAVNTIRHRMQGYVNPRPFGAQDIARIVQHAFEVVDGLQRHGVSWEGRRVLEVGPGPDMTTGAVMLDRGAASYDAVDLFDNRHQSTSEIYRTLERRLANPIDQARLGFTQTDFPALPDVTGSYDTIVSNACLEHVADAGGLLARLRELAAPGALMVHQIDGQAHMRWFCDHDPLNHLRYPGWLYRRVLDFPGAPNRLRGSEFAALARRAGWSEIEVIPDTRASAAYLRGLRVAPPYDNALDLGVLTFTLCARTPPAAAATQA